MIEGIFPDKDEPRRIHVILDKDPSVVGSVP
jgi:hypothetical protein